MKFIIFPHWHSHVVLNDSRYIYNRIPLDETKTLWNYFFEVMEDLGIHWVNGCGPPPIFDWQAIEKEGKYDWTIPDAYVTLAQKHNVNLIIELSWGHEDFDPLLVYGITPYGVESPKATIQERMVTEEEVAMKAVAEEEMLYSPGFRRWIMALVERYDGDGVDDMPGLKYPVKYWKFAGEPDWGFGEKTRWEPKLYAEVFKNAFLAAKEADPECVFMVAQMGAHQKGIPFLKAIIELSKKDDMQYLEGAYHLNCSGHREFSEVVKNVQMAKKFLNENNLNIPIWITGYGTDCGAPSTRRQLFGMRPPFYILRRSIKHTQRDQALTIIKGFIISYYLGVSKIFYDDIGPLKPPQVKLTYPPVMGPGKPGYYDYDPPEAGGLMDREQKPFLSYYAIHLFIEKLDSFKSITKLELGHGVNAYRFNQGPERDPMLNYKYLLWNDIGGNVTLTGLSSKKVEVINMIPEHDNSGYALLDDNSNPIFEKKSIEVTEGKITLTLSETPIIVESV